MLLLLMGIEITFEGLFELETAELGFVVPAAESESCLGEVGWVFYAD